MWAEARPCLFGVSRRQAYSCWSTASGARVNNYGSRIDLILAADAALPRPGVPAAPRAADGAVRHALAETFDAGAVADPATCWPPATARASSALVNAPAEHDAAGGASFARGEAGCADGMRDDVDGYPRMNSHASGLAEGGAAGGASCGGSAGASTSGRERDGAGHENPFAGFPGWFVGADVWADALGSDHAPVWADLALPSPLPRPPAPPPLSTRFMFTGAWHSPASYSCPGPTNVAPASVPELASRKSLHKAATAGACVLVCWCNSSHAQALQSRLDSECAWCSYLHVLIARQDFPRSYPVRSGQLAADAAACGAKHSLA